MSDAPIPLPRFTSPLHDERTASWLGIVLGGAFTVCFVTGLLSHLIQHPPSWFTWPARPAGLYRVSQGVHVATGIALIPLVLAKLWVVYPKLFEWPPIRDLGHAVERLMLLPLVGGMIFLLFTGTANIALWYPWRFSFPVGHYWASWITLGGLIAHVGAKSPIVRRALGRATAAAESVRARSSRRSFLGGVAATVAGITVATVGQTVRPLRAVSVLAPRDPAVGVQGLPVNKAAAESTGLTGLALADDYRLRVTGRVERELDLSRSDLAALPQRTARLPIACVEGWSAEADWTGVPVRDLLEMAGASDRAEVTVESLQPIGSYRTSPLNHHQITDRDTLLALRINGEDLHLDHGFPVRLIGPNRPGVHQTKWVSELVVR